MGAIRSPHAGAIPNAAASSSSSSRPGANHPMHCSCRQSVGDGIKRGGMLCGCSQLMIADCVARGSNVFLFHRILDLGKLVRVALEPWRRHLHATAWNVA